MKYHLPYIINLPPFMFRGENTDNYGLLKKFIFILKGKFLGLMVKKLNEKNFCKLLNLFYMEESKIYFEDGKYKKNLEKTGTISYPNKRILRMVNNYELQLNKIILTYCLDTIEFNDNDTIIDCGANIGELNIALKNKNINVNYIAFEPDLETFECLKLNNQGQNNKFFQKALSDKNEVQEFFLDSDGGNSSLSQFVNNQSSIEVECLTLDSLNLDTYIKLFKIDAEGYEPEVIKGALTTLEKVKYISVDFGHEKGFDEEATLTDVNKILYDKGYELIKFSDYRLIGLYENKNFK